MLLHSNESAYGASPHALEAMRAAVTGVERYLEFPDRLLCPAIGAAENLDPAHIVIGHGTDDLLARAARAYLAPGDNLIRSANGYLKVPNYAYANDAEVISVPDNDFVPDVDAMIAASHSHAPASSIWPTPKIRRAHMFPGCEVRRLHAALPENVLVGAGLRLRRICRRAGLRTRAATSLAEADNVIVSHTFSKIYGLAGARVGWAFGDPDIIMWSCTSVGVTFPLTTPSAAAALAALDDQGHVRHGAKIQ